MSTFLALVRSSPVRRLVVAAWRAAPGLTVAWWLLTLGRGVLPAAFTLAMGRLVGAISDGRDLTGPLTLLGGVFVVMQTVVPLHTAVAYDLGDRLSIWLHERLVAASVRPDGLAHLERPDLADELAAARDFDLGITAPDIAYCIPSITMGAAGLVGGALQALLIARFRWWAAIAVAAAWIVSHALLRKGAVWKHRQDPDVVEEQRRAHYAYRIAVEPQAAKELRLFGLGSWVIDGFVERRLRLLDRSWTARRLTTGSVRAAMLLIVGANVAVFMALASEAAAGRIDVAVAVVVAQAAIGAGTLAYSEFDWWLDTAARPVPLAVDLAARMAPVGALTSGTQPADGLPSRELRFEGVAFAYPGTTRPVLAGFDLAVPAGSSLAVVGRNGAGKTTLAKLLCRLYDPDEGRITVDGVDLRDLDLGGWRRRVAAVFQDFVRYELPLRDNVDPAHLANDAAVADALADARADGLAELGTPLSRMYEGGTDLSGGQWQRVALARALLSVWLGAGVILLDEPTAQLDVRGEAEIFDRLLAATRGHTTILVSHRFSTVRKADRIAVVERGRVIELGSHEELMALGGRYQTMFELQARRFAESGEDVADSEMAEVLDG